MSLGLAPAFAQTELTLNSSMNSYEPGELVTISGVTQGEQIVSVQVKDPTGKTLLVRSITADGTGNYSLEFKIPKTATQGSYIIVASVSIDMIPVIETITVLIQDENKSGSTGTDNSSKEGGGCLIATATYGSEMAIEVQQLRELRDNQLLQTESGTAFMGTFNDIYYSFSPIIADYERENPLFKEAVKLAITPLLSTLSLMENAESESEVLGIGLSVIALNIGMYLGVPAIVVIGIRKRI